ncbi:MAG: nuclease of the RecB family-like protein [Rhizobium sp.]|nr:nuclease of the RecB family-like protein [Rhizobium sp.]
MVQRHKVVLPAENGGVQIYPLKEWARSRPDLFPPGFDLVNSTSHRMRSALLQSGWSKEETESEYRLIAPDALVNATSIGEIHDAPEDMADEPAMPFFSLEFQLRDFLAANLSTIEIEGKKLRLYVDPFGKEGVEYPTGVGPIDILATDQEGSFYVFELKRANSPDRAIGQVARYMGWLKQTIARENKVFGVIVSRSVSTNLKYARTIVPGIFLYEYEVSFSLRQMHDLPTS